MQDRLYPGLTDVRTSLDSTASPFSKLALAHAVGVCGDIFVTVALADSIFFNVGASAARPKVLLYLVFTMAPFAVVAPVLGPFIDRSRGGRRLLFMASCAGRAVLCLFMAANIKGLGLYPLAFASLVFSKGQNIAKSALVPAVVDDDSELVRANSQLQLISVLAGTVGAGVAAAFLKTVGGAWVLRAAFFVFLAATLASARIPRAQRVEAPETNEQRRELQAASIVVAGTAMGLLRGVVGFMTFFVGFLLKKQHEPTWVYGLVLSMSATGNGIGVLLAPQLRKKIREEWILTGSILVPAVLLVFAARSAGRASLSIAAFSIAGGAACGRLVFDSLLQRDAHDAARSRVRALRDPVPARLGRRRRARRAVSRQGTRWPVPARPGAALCRSLVSRHRATARCRYRGRRRRSTARGRRSAARGRRNPLAAFGSPAPPRAHPNANSATARRGHRRSCRHVARRPTRHIARRPTVTLPADPPATLPADPPDAFPAGG